MTLISDEFETLTKDQKHILSVLYKNYLECVKCDTVKLNCNDFKSAKDIHSKYFQKLHFVDVENKLKKLKKSDFLNGIFVSDTIVQLSLSDKTIFYFENEFKSNLKSIVDYISKIASIIPGL